MEFGTILGVLARHLRLYAIGAPLFVLVVLLGTHRITLSPLGLADPGAGHSTATARVLLDSPASQVADANPPGIDEIITRAALFTAQLGDDAAAARVAADAHVPPAELRIEAFATGPALSSPLPKAVAAAVAVTAAPYVVHVDADPDAPFIAIQATAPTGPDAAHLAGATIAALRRVAAPRGITSQLGYAIVPLGRPRLAVVAPSSGRAMTAALAFAALVIWTALVIIVPGIARWWRRLGASVPPEAAGA
jgi:hypothetical protein